MERARSPFTEISAPLLLLKLTSPAVATPGMNSASESNEFPTGRLATFSALKVSEIWSVEDSISGAVLSTVTVSEEEPSSSLTVPSEVSLPTSTETPFAS